MKILWKEVGETPLECLRRYQDNKKLTPKATYAGRLDPMAEGLILALEGTEKTETTKREIIGNCKTYEYSILLGYYTDTLDCLGLVEDVSAIHSITEGQFSEAFTKIKKGEKMPYPKYSTKILSNKDNEGALSSSFIYKNEIQEITQITNRDLYNYIVSNINKVTGDFRQEIILMKWKELLSNNPTQKRILVKAKMECSSGTYVRSIAEELKVKSNIPALILTIKRTNIGVYSAKDVII